MIHRNNMYLSRTKITSRLFLLSIFLLVFSVTFSPIAFSQTTDSTVTASADAPKTDSVYTNKTMKSVFKELKHITKTGSATLNSILMILGVVSVVAIAMYLSFRADPEEEGA